MAGTLNSLSLCLVPSWFLIVDHFPNPFSFCMVVPSLTVFLPHSLILFLIPVLSGLSICSCYRQSQVILSCLEDLFQPPYNSGFVEIYFGFHVYTLAAPFVLEHLDSIHHPSLCMALVTFHAVPDAHHVLSCIFASFLSGTN